MIGAGVSLAKALEVMTRQTANEKFKMVILAMVENIKKGKNFLVDGNITVVGYNE